MTLKTAGSLFLIAAAVALFVHGLMAMPRLLNHPIGAQQELRQTPADDARPRVANTRPVSA